MRAGQLRHRVKIQRPGGSQDETGAPTGWVDVVTVWASISPASGREIIESDAIREEITHRVQVRNYDGINTTMRLTGGSLGTRVLNIHGVMNPQDLDRYLILTCSEVK